MNVLGSRIKELRKKAGMSQESLSKELNKLYGLKTDRVMISKWETGFQTPVISTIKYLAQFFNVSIDFLNGDEIPLNSMSNLPSPNTEDNTPATDDDIKFALFNSKDGITDEMLDEVKEFAKFVMSKHEKNS